MGLGLLLASSMLFSCFAQATPHDFEHLSGLKRFDKTSLFIHPNRSESDGDSGFNIKEVKIADNVLKQAIQLAEQGGVLGRIRGGAASDKIKVSFFQPYINSRLEQRLELYFNKDNGFINQLSATYFLQDSYADMSVLREQTFSAAVGKYGPPISMQQVLKISGQTKNEVKLKTFIKGLSAQDKPNLHAIAYFEQRNISKSTEFIADPDQYALLFTGFDRCYFWEVAQFTEILSFCYFDQTGANAGSRGIELQLSNLGLSGLIEQGAVQSKASSVIKL
jgi:hypothetical protein